MKDINYPLVETKRPPIYTAMKYWGKKPHNIWGAYIRNYTKKDGCILDPFSGSSIAAFEAVKSGRKAYALDINPLTSFCIEALCSNYNEAEFKSAVKTILDDLLIDPVYIQMYSISCPKCGSATWVQHYKWNGDQIYEIGVKCHNCGERHLVAATQAVNSRAKKQDDIQMLFWYPNEEFSNTYSFSNSFINNIGGNNFSYIWTKRNLYVLSKIFDKILSVKSRDIQLQLLFGFIQIVHLSSKMCVPRNAKSNRSFSTSWGRPAYMCAHKKMEMNPLMLFEGACLGKQSVSSALTSVKSHIGKVPKIHDIAHGISKDADICYGIVDILELTKHIPEKSIDFIITDPPYGGLIQYLDLSYIWTIWLQRYNCKYRPKFNSEITIKEGVKSVEDFQKDFMNSAVEIHRVLKDEGKVIFTFNNKDVNVWKAFLQAIQAAGFTIEHIVYQPNRRTGESNVADNSGSSANDFYIRCVKRDLNTTQPTQADDCEYFIIKQTLEILSERAEPTPMSILFACLLANVSLQGFNLINFDADFEALLLKHVGKEFEIVENNNQKLLWIKNKAIVANKTLTYRIEQSVKSIARKHPNVSVEEWQEHIYKKYNNSLMPSRENIEYIISKIQA